MTDSSIRKRREGDTISEGRGPEFGRRGFTKLLAAGSAVTLAGCSSSNETSEGPNEEGTTDEAEPTQVYAPCSYCGVGCGTIYEKVDGKVRGNVPDPDHPTNQGVQCVKGLNLWQALEADSEGAYDGEDGDVFHAEGAAGQIGRLTSPLVRKDILENEDKTVSDYQGTFDGFVEVSWETALDIAADRLNRIKREHGGNSIGYYGSGQLSLEDQFMTNKIYKGVLGSNTIEANARMCMTSAVAGYFGTLGADQPPTCYEDIEEADFILDVGHNMAESHPVLHWRIQDQKESRGVVTAVQEPRYTRTVDGWEDIDGAPNIHLQLEPNQDVAILNSIGYVLVHELDAVHPDATEFIEEERLEEYIEGVKEYKPEDVAAQSEGRGRNPVTPEKIRAVAEHIKDASHQEGGGGFLTFWGIGYNQSTHGVARTRSIINLHLITGEIGKPGSGPFSMTGQPNAMGERLMGGLTNGLPPLPVWGGVGDDEARERVASIWGVDPDDIADGPNSGMAIGMYTRALAESKDISIAEARREVALTQDGRNYEPYEDDFTWFDSIDDEPKLKALWYAYATHIDNPDQTNLIRPALEGIFVMSSDIYPNAPNLLYSEVVFPASTNCEGPEDTYWGTYIQSERRIYAAENGLPRPEGTRPDLDIAIELGKRLEGGEGLFDYPQHENGDYDPEAVFEEIQETTRGTPADITGIEGYDQILEQRGIFWPAPSEEIAEQGGIKRRYMGQEAEEYGWEPPYPGAGYFPTESGKAKVDFFEQGGWSREGDALSWEGPAGPVEVPDAEYVGEDPDAVPDDKYPYWCNLGIVLEHFHSAKTIRSAGTRQLVPEQYVEIHPDDAAEMGIEDGDMVKVVSPRGSVSCRAAVGEKSTVGPGTNVPPRGSIFQPWNLSVADSAVPEENRWLTNALSRSDYDEVSGQSDYKHGVCRIEKL